MSSEPIFALWPIPIFGAEDKEGDQNAGTGTPAGNSGGNPGSQGGQGNSSKDQKTPASGDGTPEPPADDDDDDPYEGYSTKELRRIARDNERRAKEAEQERDSVKTTLTAKEREKLDKEQRQELEINDLKDSVSTLRASLAHQAIVNAIICDSRYEWHNPEIVAQQLNSEIVKVDDKGKVDGIGKELVRVAKDHEYLLKKKASQQDKGQGASSGQPTGFQPGQGGANSGGNLPPNASELAKTFPALNSRI